LCQSCHRKIHTGTLGEKEVEELKKLGIKIPWQVPPEARRKLKLIGRSLWGRKLLAKFYLIRLRRGISSTPQLSVPKSIAILKAKRLKREEIETLRRLSEALGIDYDEIKPIKPEGGGGEVVA